MDIFATSLTPELGKALGPFLQILLYLIGGFYLCLISWKALKGDPAEPKHNPPVNVQIRDRVDAAEKRVADTIGAVKAELKENLSEQNTAMNNEIHKLHGRVSNLREEIRTDLERSSAKIDQGVDKMLDIFSEQRERIGKVEANTEMQERRLAANELKLDRHIDKCK